MLRGRRLPFMLALCLPATVTAQDAPVAEPSASSEPSALAESSEPSPPLAATPPATPAATPTFVATLNPALLLAAGGTWGPDPDSPRELTLDQARVIARGIVAPAGTDAQALGDAPHFGYFLQLQTLAAPAVLDAFITGQLSRALRVDVGLARIPVSAEHLEAIAALDFDQRSRLARLLAPRRGIGVQLGGAIADGAFAWRLGTYDQNTPLGAADVPPIHAIRLDSTLRLGDARLQLGAAGAWQSGGDANDRALYVDGNARLDIARLWLTVEALFAAFQPPASADLGNTGAFGAFATLGYHITDDIHAIARYDHLTLDETADAALITALRWAPLPPVRIQMQYEWPIEGISPAALVVFSRLAVSF